jgi:putative heme-binding domain-containing protein
MHGDNNQAIRPDRARRFGRVWRIQHNDASEFEQPALHDASPQQLVEALGHPNRWQRMTAQRLLVEGDHTGAAHALQSILRKSDKPRAQVHALWTLAHLEKLSGGELAAAIRHDVSAVQQNALRIVNNRHFANVSIPTTVRDAAIEQVSASNPRTRLEALIALGAIPPNEASLEAIISAYDDLQNNWARSAAVGALQQAPGMALRQVLKGKASTQAAGLVAALAQTFATQAEPAEAAGLVQRLANLPAGANAMKRTVLRALTEAQRDKPAPDWSNALETAFRSLVTSDSAAVTAAALPLLAQWDTKQRLGSLVQQQVKQFRAVLEDTDQPVARRLRLARALLALRPDDKAVIEGVAAMLDAADSPDAKKQVIGALAEAGTPAVGRVLVNAYPTLSPDAQPVALDHILRRPAWSKQLIEAIENEKLTLTMLGPAAVDRLRNHPSDSVAKAAKAVITQRRGQKQQQIDQLVGKLLPKVSKPGDAQKGEALYQACAVCHRYEGRGSGLGPELTGIGASGTEYLLVNTIAPNRAVAPNYIAYNVTTKDGKTYQGIIEQQSEQQVVLRNQATTVELSRDNIKSMQSTGRSLMPEGFESLGAKNLRDLFTYLRQGAGNYRSIDLTGAFTTPTDEGMWRSRDQKSERIALKRYGMVRVEGIPFRIPRPGATPSGDNAVVLKGGQGYADTLPQKRSIETNVKATKLHFLGGVGGWAYPWGDQQGHDAPVLKVTVHYADGDMEELVMRNGVEYADYVRRVDVPGSNFAKGLTEGGRQARWFTKQLKKGGTIKQVELESYDNHVAPALLAITAEHAGGSGEQ